MLAILMTNQKIIPIQNNTFVHSRSHRKCPGGTAHLMPHRITAMISSTRRVIPAISMPAAPNNR